MTKTTTQPSAGALRAVAALPNGNTTEDEIAKIIDAETGCADLIAALEDLLLIKPTAVQALNLAIYANARAALKKARG